MPLPFNLPDNHARIHSPRGFALVVTLSLMILLVMLAVGLLSLSSIALRTGSQGEAMATAKSNARLALMLAIGELQKDLGPDRRISASAEILDKKPDTPAVDGVAYPHYLGVWDSWDTWLTDKKTTTSAATLTIQQTYQRGRHPALFRRWLVSHPDPTNLQTALKPDTTGTLVTLVGENSAGKSPASHVQVPKVTVQSNMNHNGTYAWWIADESQKSRLDLEARLERNPATTEAAQVLTGLTGRPGIETMTDMKDFDTKPESLAKMVSTSQTTLASHDSVNRFHDLTAYGAGLLTDVRAGGFRNDLNLAFEADTLSTSLQTLMGDKATIFGKTYDAPIRPMSGEINKIIPQNPYVAPMSWRQMREYYRLYRTTNRTLMQPVEWRDGKPETHRFLMGDKRYDHILDEPDTKGYARQLPLIRESWIIATRTDTSATPPKHKIVVVPVLYAWNPYNVTMRVGSDEIGSVATLELATTLTYQLYKGGVPVGGETMLANKTWDYLSYMVMFTETGNKDIVFAPGQVRVFTINEQVSSRTGQQGGIKFMAVPGYLPLRDTPATRALQYDITDPAPASPGVLEFSLKLASISRYNDNYYWGNSERAFTVGTWQCSGAPYGAVNERGVPVVTSGIPGLAVTLGGYSIDWLTAADMKSATIIGSSPTTRARWSDSQSQPQPVGIISLIAKSGEKLDFENNNAGFAKDYRNRTWLHAPPTGLACYLMHPQDLNRANSPYQIHFRPVNGDQEVSQYLQADGPSGYFGGGYTPATGQTYLPVLNVPTAPLVNLAGFAGMRIEHARPQDMPASPNGTAYPMYNLKHIGHTGAAFGPGVGNAYAHPMIAADAVYTRNDLGMDTGHPIGNLSSTGVAAFDDYWDHLFLANEGLWDSWFCSGIAPEISGGKITSTKNAVASNFFNGKQTLVSRHYTPNLRNNKKAADLATLVDNTTDGWQQIASYLINRGQLNVNSTSTEAWKALLMSMRSRPVPYLDAKAGNLGVNRDDNNVLVSRFPLANGTAEGNGPASEFAWRGINSLTDAEITQIATEIVRQVKLRGPFLNLTEFINRRLSTDATGMTGALQAAIDVDEFNAGYTGTSGSGGLNGAYKEGGSMITAAPANYPNPKAALGSRYAGIPGYLMQSDLLNGIGNSIAVRGDTFLIRTYGESLLANGTVAARAWCEAVVQRVPEYVDPTDVAEKNLRQADGTPAPTPALSPLNKLFGRQFKIAGFRWLNPHEI